MVRGPWGETDALRAYYGRGGDEKCARHLLGREAADLAERERDTGVLRQQRVTTGEYETQLIVLDGFVVPLLGTGSAFPVVLGDRSEQSVDPSAPA